MTNKFYDWQHGMCISYLLKFKQIINYFLKNNWVRAKSIEESDCVLIGTCGSFLPFWSKVEKKMKELSSFDKSIAVYGCLPCIDFEPFKGIKDKVKLFIHPNHPEDIEKLFGLEFKIPFKDISEPTEFRRDDLFETYNEKKRFVILQEGCSDNCNICPHKIAIGEPKSYSSAKIVSLVSRDLKEGAKIFYVDGQDAGSWGMDFDPKQTYPELINLLLELLPKDCEVHLGNLAPKWFVKYWKELSHPQITQIKIPIQTSSPRLLEVIGRDTTIKGLSFALKTLKKKNKKLYLRTEIIIGMPTETEKEFTDTLDYVVDNFDRVACYSYDFHKNTEIANLDLPFFDEKVKEDRIERAYYFFTNHKKKIDVYFADGGLACSKFVSKLKENK